VKKYFFLAAFFIISNSVFSQDTTKMLLWSDKRLEWSNFSEDNSYEKYGNYYSKLHWEYLLYFNKLDSIDNQIQIFIGAFIVPNLCWVSKHAVGNYDVLRHEQLHFDIAELFARKFRYDLLQRQIALKKYKKVINKLKNSYYFDLTKMQQYYDDDTNHGTDTKRQVWWQTNIFLQLKELELYKESTFNLTLF
jgi:hypothetical protein